MSTAAEFFWSRVVYFVAFGFAVAVILYILTDAKEPAEIAPSAPVPAAGESAAPAPARPAAPSGAGTAARADPSSEAGAEAADGPDGATPTAAE